MSKDISATGSRLKDSLTPATVSAWLPVFSKCGLQQQVQLCIDDPTSQYVPLRIFMLANMDPTHADQLLSHMQCNKEEWDDQEWELSRANTELEACQQRLANSLRGWRFFCDERNARLTFCT